jgi:hypothetical protein
VEETKTPRLLQERLPALRPLAAALRLVRLERLWMET